MNILERRECKAFKGLRRWTLVYGRRKVGKTFTLRRCLSYDLYVIVTRSGEALVEDEVWSLDSAVREAVKVLRRGGVAVVDEFQRVPERWWDLLASAHPSGVLILSGSSFGVLRRVFDARSPLLGLFDVVKIGLMKYSDALAQTGDFKLAALWRDPWTIPLLDSTEDAEKKVFSLYLSAMGLIGEVFVEEERTLTKLYEIVLSALAEGEWNSAVIANYAAARGFPVVASTISAYLNRLADMGLVDRVPIFRSKRYYHRIASTLLRLALYAEAKYHVSEGRAARDLPWGVEIQFNIGELIAEAKDGELQYIPQGDIDFVVVKGGEATGYEVKIGPFSRSEARRAAEKIRALGIPRVGLISLAERPPEVADEVYGPEDLVETAKAIYRRWSR